MSYIYILYIYRDNHVCIKCHHTWTDIHTNIVRSRCTFERFMAMTGRSSRTRCIAGPVQQCSLVYKPINIINYSCCISYIILIYIISIILYHLIFPTNPSCTSDFAMDLIAATPKWLNMDRDISTHLQGCH